MNDKIKVKLDPAEYRGWKLAYVQSHDRESDWQARKDGRFLSANSPERLYWKIEEDQKEVRRIPVPIQALWLGGYGNGWQKVEIHTVVGKGFHFRVLADGEERFERMDAVSLDREKNRDRKFIFDTPENRKIMERARKEREKAKKAEMESERLMKTLRPVSDADLELAAEAEKPS